MSDLKVAAQPLGLGGTLSRIAELDATVDAEPVEKQHVVSEVLLKQFARPPMRQGQGPRVRAYDIRYGRCRDRSPGGLGYVLNFVKFRSRLAEALWAEIETRLPDALGAVHDGTILNQPRHMATIKDCIVLHHFRSVQTLAVHEQTWRAVSGSVRRALMTNERDAVRRLIYLRSGLHIDDNAVIEQEIDELLGETARLHDSGVWFQARLEEFLALGRARAATQGLEIHRAEHGEFVIGDCPAVAVKSDGQRFWTGMAFNDAGTILLPLGRTQVASLGPANVDRTVGHDLVMAVNRIQIDTAHRRVFLHPGSGLENLVTSQRKLTQTCRRS